jgi:hypothetical protein
LNFGSLRVGPGVTPAGTPSGHTLAAFSERPHSLTISPDGEPGNKQCNDGVLFLRRCAYRQGWHGKAEDQICNNAELNGGDQAENNTALE